MIINVMKLHQATDVTTLQEDKIGWCQGGCDILYETTQMNDFKGFFISDT